MSNSENLNCIDYCDRFEFINLVSDRSRDCLVVVVNICINETHVFAHSEIDSSIVQNKPTDRPTLV